MFRNITGYVVGHRLGTTATGNDSDFRDSGALYGSENTSGASLNEAEYTGRKFPLQINFNASRSVTTSTENRPINISAIPLIVAR